MSDNKEPSSVDEARERLTSEMDCCPTDDCEYCREQRLAVAVFGEAVRKDERKRTAQRTLEFLTDNRIGGGE